VSALVTALVTALLPRDPAAQIASGRFAR